MKLLRGEENTEVVVLPWIEEIPRVLEPLEGFIPRDKDKAPHEPHRLVRLRLLLLRAPPTHSACHRSSIAGDAAMASLTMMASFLGGAVSITGRPSIGRRTGQGLAVAQAAAKDRAVSQPNPEARGDGEREGRRARGSRTPRRSPSGGARGEEEVRADMRDHADGKDLPQVRLLHPFPLLREVTPDLSS
ncbi:hypothetical protein BHE74_00051763 [Ensete ventricosum]|nr:hypothetical protein GW17_00059613 [Ensete ventricosum]RWW42663.1 hypothetical protein BHE74_00051763 [Ensete ventricosum]RZR80557.1 hypothetical protein BHM03_00006622 [Ensete ventricosum]